MDKAQILKAIKELREKSPKKKFSQSVDLLINLKNLDLKKPEHKVDLFLQLPHNSNKKKKVCALIDAQLAAKAKEACDTIILKSDFDGWKNAKKEQRKLALEHDFFIAQVDVMAQAAAVFGKVLGSRGKMPNPKAGCVVPATIPSLDPIVKKLQNTIRLQTKNELSIKTTIGLESMSDENLADNVLFVYNNLIPKLPQEKNNVKYFAIKLTMGPLFKIGESVNKK